MNVKLFFKRAILTLAIALMFSTNMSANTYIITKGEGNFLARVVGGDQVADPTLQNLITMIRTHANGNPCTIQFGSGGEDWLDLGNTSSGEISFNNTGGTWGEITLTGKAFSAISNLFIIGFITSEVTIKSEADLKATGENGTVFLNAESGRLTITGGTVESLNLWAISNRGTLTVSGGTVKATSSSDGYAIINYGDGKITVSGNATVTSACTSTYGTIYIYSNATENAWLKVEGGTVENTATNGNAIYNDSDRAITVSGGIICAKKGYAIKLTKSAPLTLNEVGTVFAYGETDTEVISGVYTQSGKAVVVAWDVLAGVTQYTAGTNNDIYKFPEAATTIWDKQAGIGGISVVHGANNCFIPIADVTVDGVGVEELSMENGELKIYPNPTTGELRIENGELKIENVEIYDIYGKKISSHHLIPTSSHHFDVSQLPAGIYFLKMGNKTAKFVKQ